MGGISRLRQSWLTMWFTLANTQNILPSGDEMAMGADIFGSSCLMRCQQGFEWIQLKGRRMISAKKLADDMADAIHLDSNLFRGFAHGFVNLPVDFYYLGRDFIDTDSRTINSYDKERMIRMVKHGMASRQSLEKVIRLFLDNFIKHVDLQKVKELSAKGGGNFLGRMAFNQLASGNMGYILSSKLIPRLVTGLTIGSILSVGAAMSRSVYVARDLQCRNPAAYNMLRRLGNLDLLYFIVADKTRPFEDAVALWSTDRNKFHQTCCYFFEKVNL